MKFLDFGRPGEENLGLTGAGGVVAPAIPVSTIKDFFSIFYEPDEKKSGFCGKMDIGAAAMRVSPSTRDEKQLQNLISPVQDSANRQLL